MKKLVLIFTLIINTIVFSQDDKTVTLVVSGQGKTQEEAKQNALRSAIEQAFGTFISSKTEILNDNLVKDEIVSISNGNIQKFDIISEVQIPDGGYATTLKATVSVTKLTSFVESKGVEVEFKGELFASNILLQELNEKNETEAINSNISILKKIANKSFDYSIIAADPILDYDGIWRVILAVNVTTNSNFINIPTLIERTIKSISLSNLEVESYKKINKSVFPITLATIDSKGIYYLRNKQSIERIIEFIYSLNNSITNFYIFNGIEKNQLIKFDNTKKESNYACDRPNLMIGHDNLRIILSSGGKPVSIFTKNLTPHYSKYRVCWGSPDIPDLDYKSLIYDLKTYFFHRTHNDGLDNPFAFKDEPMKSFSPLKKMILNNYEPGLVISFSSLKENTIVAQFIFNDYKTIDEIKRIIKYEVIKKD